MKIFRFLLLYLFLIIICCNLLNVNCTTTSISSYYDYDNNNNNTLTITTSTTVNGNGNGSGRGVTIAIDHDGYNLSSSWSDEDSNEQFNNSSAKNSSTGGFSLRQRLINSLICIICICMIIVTIIGNALVVLAVTIVRKLHTEDNANNYLLVSLAISDFLVGILVMPLALHVEIKEGNKWELAAILCDLWTLCDVLLCTASILNLVAISIDRYFIILHAMVYTQRRNAKLMAFMILCVWALSALISIPPLFGWGRPSINLEALGICLVSQDFRYQIYATSLAFYIPLLVMIIIYINIYRAARKIKKKEMETCGRLQIQHHQQPSSQQQQQQYNSRYHNSRSKQSYDYYYNYPTSTASASMSLAPQSSFSGHNHLNVLQQQQQQHNYKKKSSITSNVSNTSYHQQQQHSVDAISSYAVASGASRGGLNDSSDVLSQQQQHHQQYNATTSSSLKVNLNIKQRFSRRLTNVFSNLKRNSSLSTAHGKNQKATRTLGIIMGCFILCWLPFFILAIVKPIPLNNGRTVRDYIPLWLDSFLLWLGYFNSALNPIIYARFNTEFRRPFIEILCFRCRGINEKLRNYERRRMYMDANLFSPTINIQRTASECSTTMYISPSSLPLPPPTPTPPPAVPLPSTQTTEQQVHQLYSKIEIIQTADDDDQPRENKDHQLELEQQQKTPLLSRSLVNNDNDLFASSSIPSIVVVNPNQSSLNDVSLSINNNNNTSLVSSRFYNLTQYPPSSSSIGLQTAPSLSSLSQISSPQSQRNSISVSGSGSTTNQTKNPINCPVTNGNCCDANIHHLKIDTNGNDNGNCEVNGDGGEDDDNLKIINKLRNNSLKSLKRHDFYKQPTMNGNKIAAEQIQPSSSSSSSASTTSSNNHNNSIT